MNEVTAEDARTRLTRGNARFVAADYHLYNGKAVFGDEPSLP